MLEFLDKYEGDITVNGENVTPQNILNTLSKLKGNVEIVLSPKQREETESKDEYFPNDFVLYVKTYMTRESTPDFQFMKVWNNDVPMPLRVMQGCVCKETKGMYYVKLRGYPYRAETCACCGKPITSQDSKFFGIGPECFRKLGLPRNVYTQQDVTQVRNAILATKWEGWVPKTAILHVERKHGR